MRGGLGKAHAHAHACHAAGRGPYPAPGKWWWCFCPGSWRPHTQHLSSTALGSQGHSGRSGRSVALGLVPVPTGWGRRSGRGARGGCPWPTAEPRQGRWACSPCPRRSRRWWAGDVPRLRKTDSTLHSPAPTSSSPSVSSMGTLRERALRMWQRTLPACLPVPTGARQGSRRRVSVL